MARNWLEEQLKWYSACLTSLESMRLKYQYHKKKKKKSSDGMSQGEHWEEGAGLFLA
jgi:hypothetical protein